MTQSKTFDKAAIGFNHNITHNGKAFHVQTEDSGISNPMVITHLFVGGNILGTKKASYAHLVGTPELPTRVREIMEAQHKEMLKSVVKGAFDDAAGANVYQPGELASDKTGDGPRKLGAVSPAPMVSAPTAPPPRPSGNEARPSAIEPLPRYVDAQADKSLDEVLLSYFANVTKK